MTASIARSIVLDRIRLGLSQTELARRAGIRKETLCRIESGKQTPTIATVEKIDRALNKTAAKPKTNKTGNKKRSKTSS